MGMGAEKAVDWDKECQRMPNRISFCLGVLFILFPRDEEPVEPIKSGG